MDQESSDEPMDTGDIAGGEAWSAVEDAILFGEKTPESGRQKSSRGRGRPRTGTLSVGTYCVAVGCHNCTGRDGPRGIQFYRFPADNERRRQWIVKVNRKEPNGALWVPKTGARLCSEHFFGGKKSNDPSSLSYLPTVFPTAHVRQARATDFARTERRHRRDDEAAAARARMDRRRRDDAVADEVGDDVEDD